MKVAFGMIVFEGDYVLEQCLKQVYPYAEQIVIAEGPVKFWQKDGKTTSGDRTNEILDNFPDPDNKLIVHHGQYSEKDEQCKAYMQYVKDDIDYLWMIDCDEIYKSEDIEKTIAFLGRAQPTSVSVISKSFYGGFNHYLGGFERRPNNFRRIFKYTPGATWKTHRPPTMMYPGGTRMKHIDGAQLARKTGVEMYHYSYTFPQQVFNKINYYRFRAKKEFCIENYFERVYLPWVTGDNEKKVQIENKYNGVHEYSPAKRGPCRTVKFNGTHPEAIEESMGDLQIRFNKELSKFVNNEERVV